ncbi:synembryn-A isoform X2 [Notolabrus celidotus]|uniref:synembryn-A isoform X2 n=1 Tax=Notolabrus celidotus TaxID=1203425 RepID=UPI00148FC33A|nr:synembryn-A isoform X2 [Notolabrus celidotus]
MTGSEHPILTASFVHPVVVSLRPPAGRFSLPAVFPLPTGHKISMVVDLEGIIHCIKQGDENGVQSQLQEFNKEYAQCFFFDAEERERRKKRKLEEFRKNKVRDTFDSDSDCDEYKQENGDLVLRQNLAVVLVRFIRSQMKCHVLRLCLRSLRILSRDKKVLGPLVTDGALITLARVAGLTSNDASDESSDPDSDFYDNIITSLAKARVLQSRTAEDGEDNEAEECSAFDDDAKSDISIANSGDLDTISWCGSHRPSINELHQASDHNKVLERGKKDRRESKMDGDEDEEEEGEGSGEEMERKEAMKVLCNVVYNSTWAQERFSALRLMCGLTERVSSSASSSSPSSVQFYELRLMFLTTALRPELRTQLQQEGGVSILTAALESSLEAQWKDQYECVVGPEVAAAAAPISLEASQRVIEILKILFNITYSTHRQEPSEEDAALYRHLVAILRLCLMRKCTLSDDTDELQGHTVNLLSALPLQCLDVLLGAPLQADSQQSKGVNMDCVHILLLFMERRLESRDKMKEKLTPVLNLLTESCRAHRETRHYVRRHILPPLRDVSHRPEEGSTVKSRLIRLMTHLDTDLKHCAADLIFVLCKENVRRFVKYTGYGNAAGLLATRGLLGGQTSMTLRSDAQYSSDSDSDTEEYLQVKDRVNPVTGRVEAQQPDPIEGMTEEEKEEEAKRLIILFNKLSREQIIQPMGVNSEGKLVPMLGLRENSITEDGEPGSDNDGEEKEGEKSSNVANAH